MVTVAEAPEAPAVPVAPGVELPITVAEVVPAVVLLGDELMPGLELVLLGEEPRVPVVVLEPVVVLVVPVVLHGATVVVVLPGVAGAVWLGVIVVD